MDDLISRQGAIDAMTNTLWHYPNECYRNLNKYEFAKGLAELGLKSLPSVQPEQQWIPIKWHDCTDEDREKYGFSNDIVTVFDCEMPSDGQEILITTSHGYVCQDVCYIHDGYSLDSGYDWIEDIVAWMPAPEPYEEVGQDG